MALLQTVHGFLGSVQGRDGFRQGHFGVALEFLGGVGGLVGLFFFDVGQSLFLLGNSTLLAHLLNEDVSLDSLLLHLHHHLLQVDLQTLHLLSSGGQDVQSLLVPVDLFVDLSSLLSQHLFVEIDEFQETLGGSSIMSPL